VKVALITFSIFVVSFREGRDRVPYVPDDTGVAICTNILHAEFG